MREFLDEFALRGDDRSRAEAIAQRPESTGDPRHDAYLGALERDHRCAASPEKLLALKVLAHRVGEDEADLRLLANELGLNAADEILAIAERTSATGSTPPPASSSNRYSAPSSFSAA